MRKNKLVVGLVAVLTAATLTACGGSSKEDYLNDIESITDFTQSIMLIEDADGYTDALKELDMSTKEGKAIKDDMEDLGDILVDMTEMMKDLENYDEEKADKLQKDMEDLQKKTEKDAKAFEDAAKDKGVKDEDLEDLDFGM